MHCIYNGGAVLDWDENNSRKIRGHRIRHEVVEQGLSNSPIPIYEQEVLGPVAGRRRGRAWRADPGQKRDYRARRVRVE